MLKEDVESFHDTVFEKELFKILCNNTLEITVLERGKVRCLDMMRPRRLEQRFAYIVLQQGSETQTFKR